MLPASTPEDRSRQGAVVALRRLLNAAVRPRNSDAYAAEGAPLFAAATGRAPQSPAEIEAAFFASPRYRRWSACNRASQEMLWIAAGVPVTRDAARLAETSDELAARATGTLMLDPAMALPAAMAEIDIHLQPGGYTRDDGAGDIAAGALYEMGGNVYSFGQGMGRGDSKSGCIIAFLEERDRAFAPSRILEIGCSAGAAACHYAVHFPAARVDAIDVGAAMLRYAHARAEAIGAVVHYHQMDAAALTFADDGFDLVVTHNLIHEIDDATRRAMLREAARVARPGAAVVHQDVPVRFEALTEIKKVERSWDVRYNNEPFWRDYAVADIAAEMRDAGLDDVAIHALPKLAGPGDWFVACGTAR